LNSANAARSIRELLHGVSSSERKKKLEDGVAGLDLTKEQRAEVLFLEEERQKKVRELTMLWSDDEDDEYSEMMGGGSGDAHDHASGVATLHIDDVVGPILSKVYRSYSTIGVLTYVAHRLFDISGRQVTERTSTLSDTESLPLSAKILGCLQNNQFIDHQKLLLLLQPYISMALASHSLRTSALGLVTLKELSRAIPRFSIDVRQEREDWVSRGTTAAAGGGAEGEKPGSDEASHIAGRMCLSSEYERIFEFAQTIINLMLRCPSLQHRSFAGHCLRRYLALFSEKVRLQLIRSLIDLCPYSSVPALLLQHMKEEILEEFQQVARFLQSDASKEKLAVAPAGVVVRSFHSKVLSLDSVLFMTTEMTSWLAAFDTKGDAVATGLNVLRIFIASDFAQVAKKGFLDSGSRTNAKLVGCCFAFGESGKLWDKFPAFRVNERLKKMNFLEGHIVSKVEEPSPTDGGDDDNETSFGPVEAATVALLCFFREVLQPQYLHKCFEKVRKANSKRTFIPTNERDEQQLTLTIHSVEMAADALREVFLP
jgi:hypothetical protein